MLFRVVLFCVLFTCLYALPLLVNITTILDQQNQYRQLYGLVPLVWDANLATVAQKHANTCNSSHPITGDNAKNYAALINVTYSAQNKSLSVGENIAYAIANVTMQSWLNEQFAWTCSNDSCANGNCSRWTQIMWSNTTRVGCGRASCNSTTSPLLPKSNWEILVCNYNPAGNVISERTIPLAQCSSACVWDNWSNWTDCSAPCESGITFRNRTIKKPAFNGGDDCVGLASEVEVCNNFSCANCIWNLWSSWTNCSVHCSGGTLNRTRAFQHVPPENPLGEPCNQTTSEVLTCNISPCSAQMVNCTWNEWSPLTPCNATCDGGIQLRYRTQNTAQNNGTACSGENSDWSTCNDSPCSVNCTWESWSNFTECSALCGGGVSTRTRQQIPAIGEGFPCYGNETENITCNLQPCFVPPQPEPMSTPTTNPIPVTNPTVIPATPYYNPTTTIPFMSPSPFISPVAPTVIVVVSFVLKQTNQSKSLNKTEVERILEIIICDAIGVNPKFIQVFVNMTTGGYHVDVATVAFYNETIPKPNPGHTIADALTTSDVQKSIQQQTNTTLDTNSIQVVESPPPPSPFVPYTYNTNALGVPLWGWIIIGIGAAVIFVIVFLVVLLRKRDKAKRPWQEFV